MGKVTRKRCSIEFKSRIVLEATHDEPTLVSKHDMHQIYPVEAPSDRGHDLYLFGELPAARSLRQVKPRSGSSG
ncbi:hypothetical protein AA21952_1324 [Acetobacter oeni LMG 21952]|nr:hypothetical protein [Acetobacter oeni]GBR04153.1 hypothetical protein AA21952_1324 [Acetobacter oeni LMG 21952]